MTLALNRTRLIRTIGPTSDSPEILLQMMHAGMNIVRLNCSNSDFAWHKAAISSLRCAARTDGKRVTIIADLPGPKIRIGRLAQERPKERQSMTDRSTLIAIGLWAALLAMVVGLIMPLRKG
jgi:pyruvate kinase